MFIKHHKNLETQTKSLATKRYVSPKFTPTYRYKNKFYQTDTINYTNCIQNIEKFKNHDKKDSKDKHVGFYDTYGPFSVHGSTINAQESDNFYKSDSDNSRTRQNQYIMPLQNKMEDRVISNYGSIQNKQKSNISSQYQSESPKERNSKDSYSNRNNNYQHLSENFIKSARKSNTQRSPSSSFIESEQETAFYKDLLSNLCNEKHLEKLTNANKNYSNHKQIKNKSTVNWKTSQSKITEKRNKTKKSPGRLYTTKDYANIYDEEDVKREYDNYIVKEQKHNNNLVHKKHFLGNCKLRIDSNFSKIKSKLLETESIQERNNVVSNNLTYKNFYSNKEKSFEKPAFAKS